MLSCVNGQTHGFDFSERQTLHPQQQYQLYDGNYLGGGAQPHHAHQPILLLSTRFNQVSLAAETKTNVPLIHLFSTLCKNYWENTMWWELDMYSIVICMKILELILLLF